jgi:hypothetical protein
MSYEGGGAIQGPPGPTGATGGFTFSGPTGAILWYDGSGVTGTTTLTWSNGELPAYTMIGGPNENSIMFDDGAGSMRITVAEQSVGNSIEISAGSAIINLTDQISGGAPGSLQISLNGVNGASGQYLGSDGNGNVIWSIPPTSSGPTGPTGPTGGTGPTGPTGPTGGAILSGLAAITDVLSTEYFIALPSTPVITSNAVIQATLQVPDGVSQNWIVYAEPEFGTGGAQYIHVSFSLPVGTVGTTIAWAVIATDCTPSNPATSLPVL